MLKLSIISLIFISFNSIASSGCKKSSSAFKMAMEDVQEFSETIAENQVEISFEYFHKIFRQVLSGSLVTKRAAKRVIAESEEKTAILNENSKEQLDKVYKYLKNSFQKLENCLDNLNLEIQ